MLYYDLIKSFADKTTEAFYITGQSKKIPTTIQRTALRKLTYLNAASDVKDLKSPPGNRLEQLKGDLEGKYSIRLTISIVFSFDNHDAYDVIIVDYH